jgi:hypothetical protein
MKTLFALLVVAFTLVFASVSLVMAGDSPPADTGWPRVIKKNGKELTIYQPQVDYWKNYQEIRFRCAISVKTG